MKYIKIISFPKIKIKIKIDFLITVKNYKF